MLRLRPVKVISGGGHNNSARVGGRTYSQAVQNFVKRFLP